MAVNRRQIAIVIGLLMLFALPIVQADAYAVAADSDLVTIREQRSVVVHVSEPGRYVLHVDAGSELTCAGCDDDTDRPPNAEAIERFGFMAEVDIASVADANGIDPSRSSSPASVEPGEEPPPPRS